MKYEVLKEYVGRTGILLEVGEIVVVNSLSDNKFAQGLIRNGFIRKIEE